MRRTLLLIGFIGLTGTFLFADAFAILGIPDDPAPHEPLRTQPPIPSDSGRPSPIPQPDQIVPTNHNILERLLEQDQNRRLRREPLRSEPSQHTRQAIDPRTATAQDFLRQAQAALGAGRRNEAINMIDQAQTRLLHRSVNLNKTMDQIVDDNVTQLTKAKQMLRSGNLKGAETSIEIVLIALP